MTQWWAEPTAGDIVWCHFPNDIHPRPKRRPALILVVFDDDAPRFEVRVVYGTSQRTTTLYRGVFAILRSQTPAAYQAAGLSYDTKFDLKQTLDLPYTTGWFSVPRETHCDLVSLIPFVLRSQPLRAHTCVAALNRTAPSRRCRRGTDNFTGLCLAAPHISARAPALREVTSFLRILGKRDVEAHPG